MRSAVFAFLALSCIAAMPLAAQELSRPAASALYVSQVVGLDATSTIRLSVGFPGSLQRGGAGAEFGADAAARDPSGYGFSGIAPAGFAGPVKDRTAAQSKAQAWLSAQWPDLRARLVALMDTLGANYAFYSYAQQVAVAGDPGASHLTFVALVDPTGHANYGWPQLRSSQPIYVVASYTSSSPRSAARLDGAHAYGANRGAAARDAVGREAGVLRWQLADAELNPVGAPSTVHASAAAGAVADLRSVMARSGASGAFVDDWRVADASCPDASGAGRCSTATSTIHVDERSLTWSPGCRAAVAIYRNRGRAARVVESRGVRYWVDATGGQPRPIGVVQRRVTTQPQPYERELRLQASQAAAVAGSTIINPWGAPSLVAIGEDAGTIATLAPLQMRSAAAGSACR